MQQGHLLHLLRSSVASVVISLGVVEGGLLGGPFEVGSKAQALPSRGMEEGTAEAKARMWGCGGPRTGCSLLEESWERITFFRFIF